MIIIRPIKKEDNQQIKVIIQTSLRMHGLDQPGTAYYDPQLGHLYEYYQTLPQANYWIAQQKEEVVGGIGIAPYNKAENICELQKLYVASNMQGQGIGKQLMDTALSFAKKHYKTCYLETRTQLVGACYLYETYGFDLLDQPLMDSVHPAMDAWYLKDLTK